MCWRWLQMLRFDFDLIHCNRHVNSNIPPNSHHSRKHPNCTHQLHLKWMNIFNWFLFSSKFAVYFEFTWFCDGCTTPNNMPPTTIPCKEKLMISILILNLNFFSTILFFVMPFLEINAKIETYKWTLSVPVERLSCKMIQACVIHRYYIRWQCARTH